jgi:sarcosine oxidase
MAGNRRGIDVAVVGLGAVGSAVLYQLAKRGVKAMGLDRFGPPHDHGSSHGETRITRQAVGEGSACAPFVLDAHRIWRELEAETGERLLVACGALVMSSSAAATAHHGQADFLVRSIETAQEFGIAHELLDGAEIVRRFPQFLGLSGAARAYYEPGGGYVLPERCIAAQLRTAAKLGAHVRTAATVCSVEQDGAGVRIETDGEAVLADRAVIAAGPWTSPLLGAPFDRLLKVSRQVLYWFVLDDVTPYQDEAPVYIWMHGPSETDYFYGFPPLPGENRVKVASEQYATTTTADRIDRTVTASEAAQMFDAHLRGRLAGAIAPAVATVTCLYTTTPDRGFIIDRHPDMDRVVVVSACSGHGFKHSAGIGKAVAEWVAAGRSRVDLTPFRLSRFA